MNRGPSWPLISVAPRVLTLLLAMQCFATCGMGEGMVGGLGCGVPQNSDTAIYLIIRMGNLERFQSYDVKTEGADSDGTD